MNSYQKINDQRYAFIPQMLRNAILSAGRKRIIFIEGYDDRVIFNIFYTEHSNVLCFIDISLEEEKRTSVNITNEKIIGGCEGVKNTLKLFVSNIPDEKRFFGVIDRDLNTDAEIQAELAKSCYDGRLYIFSRYTIENYFIEQNILLTLLRDISISHKKLLNCLADLENNDDVIMPILECMAIIAASNLTIQYFNCSNSELINNAISLLEATVDCSNVENRLIQKLKNYETEEVILNKFNEFKITVSNSIHNIHKFASAKTYFSYQFNQKIQALCGVSLQINKHKAELARITKEQGIPNDFQDLLSFVTKAN